MVLSKIWKLFHFIISISKMKRIKFLTNNSLKLFCQGCKIIYVKSSLLLFSLKMSDKKLTSRKGFWYKKHQTMRLKCWTNVDQWRERKKFGRTHLLIEPLAKKQCEFCNKAASSPEMKTRFWGKDQLHRENQKIWHFTRYDHVNYALSS